MISIINSLIIKIKQYFLVKYYPDYYEFKNIERISSSGSFIEYIK